MGTLSNLWYINTHGYIMTYVQHVAVEMTHAIHSTSQWYMHGSHLLLSCGFMMTSSNGNFSALLGICAGNSPVTGEFPTQRSVTRSFDVLFDLRLNKRFSKQSWVWWFETPLRPLWRHCNVFMVHFSLTPQGYLANTRSIIDCRMDSKWNN